VKRLPLNMINDHIHGLMDENGSINKENILKIIPYKDQFLMMDQVLYLDQQKIIVTKNVPLDDFWVTGHFTDFPIMPGVLVIEVLAQAGSLLARYNLSHHQEKDLLARTIEKSRFLYPIFPGDHIKCEVAISEMNEKVAVFNGKVWVKDRLCTEAEFTLAIVDKENFRNKFRNQ